jgi:hypothetical protein
MVSATTPRAYSSVGTALSGNEIVRCANPEFELGIYMPFISPCRAWFAASRDLYREFSGMG